jgi:hypothetical protein
MTTTASRYRHKKRGTSYTIVGTAQVQAPDDAPLTDFEVVVVYRGDDGNLWVRRRSEFFDGRFEQLAVNYEAPESMVQIPEKDIRDAP